MLRSGHCGTVKFTVVRAGSSKAGNIAVSLAFCIAIVELLVVYCTVGRRHHEHSLVVSRRPAAPEATAPAMVAEHAAERCDSRWAHRCQGSRGASYNAAYLLLLATGIASRCGSGEAMVRPSSASVSG